jgi:hypothetical protein
MVTVMLEQPGTAKDFLAGANPYNEPVARAFADAARRIVERGQHAFK